MPVGTSPNRPLIDRREIRVFISSTFGDMQEEREELVKQIFPQLRRLCESRGVTWGDVDLRWGVPDEAKAEGKVLPLCLQEIEHCRPYFIGLLGERYGWVPEEISPELLETQPWLAQHRGKSVTALEILHGVLENPEMAEHAFFYFRDPAYAAARSGFTEENPRLCERLAKLKDDIRRGGHTVSEPFATPKQLGEWVLRDLTAVIEQLYPEASIPDALDHAALDHEAYSASRRVVYIGRQEYVDRLNAHAAGDGSPLVIAGDSGGGKSALLANWSHDWREQHLETPVLIHFIGAAPDSANWMAMLRRLLGEFQRKFGIQIEIPDQSEALRMAFANSLHMVATHGRLVLVLDALNQIEGDRDGSPDLVWLPQTIPANVRLIVSTLPGPSWEELEKRGWPVMAVEPLTVPEREKLIATYLKRYAKALSPEPAHRIAAASQTGNGLYLSTLLNELRQFGSYEKLNERIDRYMQAANPIELYRKVIERWEQDYGQPDPARENVVRESLTRLWAARRGLSDIELLESLGTAGSPLPRAHWSPLYLAAGDALVNRGGLLAFAHVFLREAVRDAYLPTKAHELAAHHTLAKYFEAQPQGLRQLDELPWQWQGAAEWEKLRNLLAIPAFLAALQDRDRFEVKSIIRAGSELVGAQDPHRERDRFSNLPPTVPPEVEARPLHLDENVQFTVYRPAAVQVSQWYTLLAFAHLSERRPEAPPEEPEPLQEVRQQAASVLGDDAGLYGQVSQDSAQAVPREGEITFAPEIRGVEFNPPRRTFLWQESVHREEFRMRATLAVDGRVARGSMTVFLGSIIIGNVPISIRVGGTEVLRQVSATSSAYRKIFASYSHRDVAIVEECERYARAVGDKYLRDILDLQPGEVWDERLRQMIEDADVFQLFWSRNSMRSDLVRQEWEHALALRNKGRAFIRPVYWEEPLPGDPTRDLPPEKLRRLHFQRLSISIGSAEADYERMFRELPSTDDQVRLNRSILERLGSKSLRVAGGLHLDEDLKAAQLIGLSSEGGGPDSRVFLAPTGGSNEDLSLAEFNAKMATVRHGIPSPPKPLNVQLKTIQLPGLSSGTGGSDGELSPLLRAEFNAILTTLEGISSPKQFDEFKMRFGDLRGRVEGLLGHIKSEQDRRHLQEFGDDLDRYWKQLQKVDSEIHASEEISDIGKQLVSVLNEAQAGVVSDNFQTLESRLFSIQAAVADCKRRHQDVSVKARTGIDDLEQAVARYLRQLDDVRNSMADADILNPLVTRFNELQISFKGTIRNPEALHELLHGMQSLADDLRGAADRLHSPEARSTYSKLRAAVNGLLRQLAGETSLTRTLQPRAEEVVDAFDSKWTGGGRRVVVLLPLAAVFVMLAVTWWHRIPWRPLASLVHWGAWMLAGLYIFGLVTAIWEAIRHLAFGRRAGTPR
jgi:hypothetical protein